VISSETRIPGHAQEPALCFTGVDLEDVVSHENDLVVISVVTVGRKVHKVWTSPEELGINQHTNYSSF